MTDYYSWNMVEGSNIIERFRTKIIPRFGEVINYNEQYYQVTYVVHNLKNVPNNIAGASCQEFTVYVLMVEKDNG